MNILVIPDTQCKKGVDISHLQAMGNYIVAKKPEVIVHIGDHWDMPSLSSYAKKMEIEGQRVKEDLEFGKKAMDTLMRPLFSYNERRRRWKEKLYRPRLEFCLGNHEERVLRFIKDNPNLDGLLKYPDCFKLKSLGWNVNDFLKPFTIEGISFAHYFYNPMSGRPYGGKAHSKLNHIKNSFVMGHQQGLDIATTTDNTGQKYWGIVAGSFYTHNENYIGHQGNDHWRGAVMLHDVENGDCAPCVINMKHLLEKYL